MNCRLPLRTIDIGAIEKTAQKLRTETAKLLSRAPAHQWKRGSASSHYNHYWDSLPLPSGPDGLMFNDAVTDSVLTEHVLTQSDPLLVTFLGAKVIEQNFYQFFDPIQPAKPIKNLSISKHFGTFFTPPDIAEVMAAGLMDRKANSILLDPCVGSGVLLCSAMIYGSITPYKKLIGIELDTKLSFWAQLIVERVAVLTGFMGEIEIRSGDGLDYLLAQERISPNTVDVIINPPYGRVRITNDRFTNKETILALSQEQQQHSLERIQSHLKDFSGQLKKKFSVYKQERGILEYSKIFFRACAQLTQNGSTVSLISPSSWMSGNDSALLRTFLLENRLIDSIILIRENDKKFATVNQATAITFLSKATRTYFELCDLENVESNRVEISYETLVRSSNAGCSIPRVSGPALELFKKLNGLTKFREISWIVNARGELDQTLQKSMLCEQETTTRLVRGEHINRFHFEHKSNKEKPSFVDTNSYMTFMAGKPKAAHSNSLRIVGRQCSYAQQPRRLIFCVVPSGVAVGNSCNYIHIFGPGEVTVDRAYLLLGLLNSAVLDWFFNIENSNNHVANYEIDNFPFPTNERWFALIASLANQIENAAKNGKHKRKEWLTDLLEAAVSMAYGLNPEQELQLALDACKAKRKDKILNYASYMSRGIKLHLPTKGDNFFNNALPTLSELDRQIISHVPEGGNWQNIPETVASERVKQIRAMSVERGVVRTTYYGRLRRDQPAYTINTYFNRPGNGTHIHPTLDRTLTSREAARLQSFPDSYLFVGSEGAIRDQIGNAVPPLLAAEIGKKLLPYATTRKCVDIFCGAGGLSLGLETAGWHVLAAIDNNKEALDTYCFNRPCNLEPDFPATNKTGVYRRDLHGVEALDDICKRIEKSLDGDALDLLVGGPPCQGFSHAGYRLMDDKRNDLASVYLHFAERLKPKIFILENVEGLATYKGGKVLADICSTLVCMGFRVNNPVWKLNAEQYGVPQMRRRVFVVATLSDEVDLSCPIPTFERCHGRRSSTAIKSLFDDNLPSPWTVADAFAGLSMTTQGRENRLIDWFDSTISDCI